MKELIERVEHVAEHVEMVDGCSCSTYEVEKKMDHMSMGLYETLEEMEGERLKKCLMTLQRSSR